MKRIIGTFCMVLGLIFLLGAGALLYQNQSQELLAEAFAAEVVPQLVEQIRWDPAETTPVTQLPEKPSPGLQTSVPEMGETQINGYAYIGILSLPSLGLELPIMADWDYDRLQIAPCRYYGNLHRDDLVLMAHNYRSHFGRLSELSLGDTVLFTDVDGVVTEYTVVVMDVLVPDAVEEVTAGDFDLALFTCTYGGKSRVTVYCDRKPQSASPQQAS